MYLFKSTMFLDGHFGDPHPLLDDLDNAGDAPWRAGRWLNAAAVDEPASKTRELEESVDECELLCGCG